MLLSVLMCFVSNSGAETVIYLDKFDGAAGDVLNGQAPDVSLIDGATWQSGTSGEPWMADGTITLRRQSSNAFLPFVPESGKVYSLSFEVCPEGPLGAGFISLGFAGTNAVDEAFVGKEAMVSPWMYVNHDWIINPRSRLADESNETKKITRTYRTYLGPGNFEGIPPKEAYGEWISTEITLDTREDIWSVKWFVNGECIRAGKYEETPDIHYVGIGRFREVSGTVDHFKLSIVSE